MIILFLVAIQDVEMSTDDNPTPVSPSNLSSNTSNDSSQQSKWLAS